MPGCRTLPPKSRESAAYSGYAVSAASAYGVMPAPGTAVDSRFYCRPAYRLLLDPYWSPQTPEYRYVRLATGLPDAVLSRQRSPFPRPLQRRFHQYAAQPEPRADRSCRCRERRSRYQRALRVGLLPVRRRYNRCRRVPAWWCGPCLHCR